MSKKKPYSVTLAIATMQFMIYVLTVLKLLVPEVSQIQSLMHQTRHQWRSEGRAWADTCPAKAPCSSRSCHAISREREANRLASAGARPIPITWLRQCPPYVNHLRRLLDRVFTASALAIHWNPFRHLPFKRCVHVLLHTMTHWA